MKLTYAIALSAVVFGTAAFGGVALADDDDDDDGGDVVLRARLTGDAEVPPVETDTSGRARVRFDGDRERAEFRLRISDGERITQVHIHCAPEGVNGPVVAFLAGFHELGWDVDGLWIRNADLSNANVISPAPDSTCPNAIESLDDLAEAGLAGNLYVNVHSVRVPSGEVRGQLRGRRDDDDD